MKQFIDFWATYLVKLDDIWMSDLLQYVDFASDSFHVALIFDPIFLKYFNGNLFSGYGVSADSHFSKCA